MMYGMKPTLSVSMSEAAGDNSQLLNKYEPNRSLRLPYS
jgi:hypothetical protein